MNSLRGRVRLLNLSLTVALAIAALLAVSRLRVLERAVTDVLSRDYQSIESATGMLRAMDGLVVAVRDRSCPVDCPRLRAEFERWIATGSDSYTEPGEPQLARTIGEQGRALFDAAEARAAPARIDAEVSAVRASLDALVALNRDAMFAADRSARGVANHLMFVTVTTFGLVALVVFAAGWMLSGAVARPLTELAARLRGVGPRGPYPPLGPQPVAELEQVAEEYRRMACRLEEFERLNLETVLDEKAKTEAVIESIEDGLIVLDPNGAVVHMNEVACAILDLRREQALGRRFEELPGQNPRYVRLRQAVRGLFERSDRDGERIELTLFFRGRDHHYVLRPTPFHTGELGHSGVILVLQDVTFLREQDARREQLVATLSHELRSPLTSLRMAVELLRHDEEAMPPAQRELLRAANEDVERLQEVAQHLLDLSRSRAASIALAPVELDVREVVDGAVRLYGLQARESGVFLEWELPSERYWITADPTKLTWALSNLLSNALRHTPSGGRVSVVVCARDGAVQVTVGDTGPGIPEQQRDRIFEPFFQSAENGKMGAAGLGLAIVREIVEAHGGRIHLESVVGEGSRFTLELPRS